MVKVFVKIREVATGKVVDYSIDIEDKYADNQGFYYGEGNGSCDCNRKLMFGQAQGIEFSDEETPCGSKAFEVQVYVGGDLRWSEWRETW